MQSPLNGPVLSAPRALRRAVAPFALTDGQAIQYLWDNFLLKRTVGTLSKERSIGTGPEFFKIGKTVRYTVAALDEWAMSQVKPGPARKPRKTSKGN